MTGTTRADASALKLDAARPLYLQVKDFVIEHIRAGTWDEGRIPSESFLVENLGVSRMTVHRALRELKDERMVVRVPGRGTFVSSEKPRSTLLETQDIAQEIRNRDSAYRCHVDVLEQTAADHDTAAALEMKAGEEVFHSRIVHYENDVPVQLEERWVKPAIAPGYLQQDFTQRTPHDYITFCAVIVEVEHVLQAIRPEPRAMELLQLQMPEPCLLLARRTWAEAGVATRNFFTYPGSRYSLGGRYKVTGEMRSPVLASVVSPLLYRADHLGGAEPKAERVQGASRKRVTQAK